MHEHAASGQRRHAFFAQSAPLTAEDEVRERTTRSRTSAATSRCGTSRARRSTATSSRSCSRPTSRSSPSTPSANPCISRHASRTRRSSHAGEGRARGAAEPAASRGHRARLLRPRRPPILELIHPMTTSARELDRVREYYERFRRGWSRSRSVRTRARSACGSAASRRRPCA